MGTNYYLETEDRSVFKQDCPCCGKPDYIPPGAGRLHIGKASMGWCFALHVCNDVLDSPNWDAYADLEEWKQAWSKPGVRIVDEYGTYLTPDEMLKIITERKSVSLGEMTPGVQADWKALANEVPELREPFNYEKNRAEPGPNGLARSKVDYMHCIGHGEGTWDLCVGEFS